MANYPNGMSNYDRWLTSPPEPARFAECEHCDIPDNLDIYVVDGVPDGQWLCEQCAEAGGDV